MAPKMAAYTFVTKRFIIPLFLLSILALALSNPQRPHAVQDLILANAPWSVKLMLLKDLNPPKKPPGRSRHGPRRVGMESLVMRRADAPLPAAYDEDPNAGATPQPNDHDDDSNMRLKLFRLMYETVRDSDLKVKRAELIRKHYSNSTAFEVGFLMGEVQEKFDVIIEFSGTLKKFYDKWKPIEHINAYEQIANYGIQINHLIDLIRTISKNGSLTH